MRRLMCCLLPIFAAACEAEAIDEPPATGAISVTAAHPGPDQWLDGVARAPLVVIARPVTSQPGIQRVLVQGREEEREITIADVEVLRVLAGDEVGTRIVVLSRDGSLRARLRVGQELLLSLHPDDDGSFRVDHSFAVREGVVPALDRAVDDLPAELEVTRAR